MKAVIMVPPTTVLTPGALGHLAVQGVRSYLCMDEQSQGLEVEGGQAGRILESDLDSRAHLELYPRASIHRKRWLQSLS